MLGVGLTGFLTLGLLAQVVHVGWGMWVTEVTLFGGVAWVALRLGGRSPLRAAGLSRPWLSGAAFGFAVGLVNFFGVAVPSMALAQHLFPEELVRAFDASQVFRNQTPVELALIVTGVTVAAPACEELFFRGVVQQGLMTRQHPARAIVTTAVLFSAFHLDPVGLLARFELGLVFGLLAWRARSIWPAIFAHAANNLTSVVAYFATRDQPDSDLAWWVPVSLFAGGCLGLTLLYRVARRRPGLLTPPPDDTPEVPPAPGLGPAVAPFAAFAGGTLAVLLLVDPLVVKVNFVDAGTPTLRPGQPPLSADERDRLVELRRQARSGELSLSLYSAERRRIAERRGAADGGTGAPDAGP